MSDCCVACFRQDVIVPPNLRKGQKFKVKVNYEYYSGYYRPIMIRGRPCALRCCLMLLYAVLMLFLDCFMLTVMNLIGCGIHVPHNEHACGNRLGRVHMFIVNSIHKIFNFIFGFPGRVADKFCDGFDLILVCVGKIRKRLCGKRGDKYAVEEEVKVKTPEEVRFQWKNLHFLLKNLDFLIKNLHVN